MERWRRRKVDIPTGYLSVASEKRLTAGVQSLDNSKPAHRADVYRMIYNTIHADMAIFTSVGSEQSYEVYRDRNLLTENHAIYQVKGVVTADDTLAIEGSKLDKAGSFRIGGMEINSDLQQTKGKVGRNVRCYYKEKQGDEYQAVAIYDKDNNIVTLTADNVLNFDWENGYYEVYDGSRKTKLTIGSQYALVYNDDLIDGSDKAMMQPSTGSITLIDNDTDGTYDVVMVEEYYNLLFAPYDSYKEVIYDKKAEEPTPGGNVERNVELDLYRVVESTVDLSKLSAGAIISVYKSPSEEKIRLEASSKTVTGSITSTYANANGNFLEVDGVAYKVSGDARFSYEEFTAGRNVKLTLDAMGQVANAALESGQRQGYFLEFQVSSNSMEPCWANILMASGKVQDYALCSKVRLETPSGSESVADKEVAGRIGPYARGLVLYETNEEQKISKIVLPWEINTEEEFSNLPQYPLLKINYLLDQWPNKSTNKAYKREINGFDNWLIFDADAAVYTVPGEQDDYDEKEVSTSGISSFVQDKTIKVPADVSAARVLDNIDVYKVGSDGLLPNIMIHYSKLSGTNVQEDKEPAVVTKVSKIVDEKEGVPAVALDLLQGGQSVRYQLADEGLLTQEGRTVQMGDIIKFGLDSDNKISVISHQYSSETHENVYNADRSFNNVNIIYRLACGTVTRAEGNYFEVELQYGANKKTERYQLSGKRIVVCDMLYDKTVNMGSAADIAVGDKIVLYSRYVDHKLVVVYKEGN